MNPASIDDIKNELKQLPPKKVLELTLRLARFKKENKELLTYLLFESHDEAGYIKMLQADIEKVRSESGSHAPIMELEQTIEQYN